MGVEMGRQKPQESSPSGSLLLDIFVIFVQLKRERLFSRDLVSVLAACEGRPWAELRRGKRVTQT